MAADVVATDEPELEVAVSTFPLTVELGKSISNILFLKGIISGDDGTATILICVDVAPSTLDILVMFALGIVTLPAM